MKKLLLFTTLLLSVLFATNAQAAEEPVKVFFPFDATQVTPSYRDNATRLDKGVTMLRHAADSLDWSRYTVVIEPSSSPEGDEAVNARVSERRARALANYITQHAHIAAEHITISKQRVDWRELIRLLNEDRRMGSDAVPYVKYLDEVCGRIEKGEVISDADVLKGFRASSPVNRYTYIRRNIFPRLRFATAVIVDKNGQQVDIRQTASDWDADELLKAYYPFNYSTIQPAFKDNEQRLEEGISLLRRQAEASGWNGYHARVTSSSSPEGSEEVNTRMSQRRGQALVNYLKRNTPLTDQQITIENHRVDWAELRRLISEDQQMAQQAQPYVSYLDSIVGRIQAGQVVRDARVLRELRAVNHGRQFAYIRQQLFPRMRYAKAVVTDQNGNVLTLRQTFTANQDTIDDTPEVTETTEPAEEPVDSVVVTEPEEPTAPTEVVEKIDTRKPLYLAAKTNLLYDVALLPNIGVEWAFSKHWSVSASWEYAWWANRDKHRYWRIYGGDAELRYWLGGDDVKPLTGHHVGAYAGILTYDIEFGGKGYLGPKWSYMFGLSYGYSLPIARRFNLDFGIGIGYLGGDYYEYEPIGRTYYWQQTKKRQWFGPTKAEVSLVWLLGPHNYNKSKKK